MIGFNSFNPTNPNFSVPWPQQLRNGNVLMSIWDGAGNLNKSSWYSGSAWNDNGTCPSIHDIGPTGFQVYYPGGVNNLFHYTASTEL